MTRFQRTAVCLLTIIPCAVPFAGPAATGSSTDAAVRAAVDRLTGPITEIRHVLHQNPELGNREFRTAELVARQLKEDGIEVTTGIAHTGVVGILKGGRPGPIVAVRADMDALPVTEDTPYPFKSTARASYLGQEVGVSHACGHDIHVAVQLGVARILAGMRQQLPGTVLFVFQPAEEGAPPGEEGGADLMLREGVFRDLKPAAVFGLHTFSEMEVGRVGYTPGPAMASSTWWRARVIGKQAHGARPDEAIDPIVMASQIVLALQTIRSRTLSPFAPTVLTVGIIRGGERMNIIPGEVAMEGTIRTFDGAVLETIKSRMKGIFEGTTSAAGGSFTLEFPRTVPVTVNDPDLAARMRPTLERVVGKESVLTIEPTTGAEDFAHFATAVPGFYFRLGTVKPGTTSGGHHTPGFMADDGAIPVGMRAMTALLLDYLHGAPAAR